MNIFKKIMHRKCESESTPNEMPQIIADDNFDDEEYIRIKTAKNNLLSRMDKDKIYDICSIVEMKSYLMDDHKIQYRDL